MVEKFVHKCTQNVQDYPQYHTGGLEVLLMAKLTILDEKRRYLAHLETLIERNYQVAEKEEDDLHEQEENICDDNEDDTIILEDDEHDI